MLKEGENISMQYPIEVNAQYIEKQSRLTTFFRIFMLIPQMIVLYFIEIAAAVIQFITWWAILFTGRNPKGLWDFNVWCFLWMTRVNAYASLITDKYPPFSGAVEVNNPPAAAPNPPQNTQT
jgi:hypothetical protein